jgi:hypothetical protein
MFRKKIFLPKVFPEDGGSIYVRNIGFLILEAHGVTFTTQKVVRFINDSSEKFKYHSLPPNSPENNTIFSWYLNRVSQTFYNLKLLS